MKHEVMKYEREALLSTPITDRLAETTEGITKAGMQCLEQDANLAISLLSDKLAVHEDACPPSPEYNSQECKKHPATCWRCWLQHAGTIDVEELNFDYYTKRRKQ